jgi:hypothetical protein
MDQHGNPSDGDALRFDAPASDPGQQGTACSMCAAPIRGHYYEIGGNVACASCRQQVQHHLDSGSARAALGWGALAAAAGAGIYYAISALTGYEFGLIAILVGYMVGGAVRKGAHGKFGRRYKLIAVGLTYLAIGSTYVPYIFAGMKDAMVPSGLAKSGLAGKHETPGSASAAAIPANADIPEQDTSADPREADATDLAAQAADSLATGTPATPQPAAGSESATPSLAVAIPLAILGLLALALLAPILGIIFGLPASILGAIILGVALHQAWRMNVGETVAITGPYRLGADGTASAA